MNYSKLPPVKLDKSLELSHFPSSFHAAVFRLWETAEVEKIAKALGVSNELIEETAESMGLPKQKYLKLWAERGYITTIKNAWHILPYEQLLTLLGWDEERLAITLKEDDFLDVKMGYFKPFCEKVVPPEVLSESQKEKLENIKKAVKENFYDLFENTEPFSFLKDDSEEALSQEEENESLRIIFSYCGLYAGVLENDTKLSCPDSMLKKYKAAGVNAVWIPVLLYQLVPFYFDESYSKGYEMRQQRLRELIERAKAYGIKIFLYINEPRCMPLKFFENHKELKGRTDGRVASLCTSKDEVLKYLRYAIKTLCESVSGIGGFFTITCSENLTHCKSRREGSECPVCKDVPVHKLVSDVIMAIYEETVKVDNNIKVIAWSWAWGDYMSREEIKSCIDRLDKNIIIQCNSEAEKPFEIGGVKGKVNEYSMSIPGPGELSEFIWKYAKQKGHKTSAKVQVNVTWECSTVPYLPVFDLVREHMSGLKKQGVDHLMLSWTLGGYPSVNLKVASECLKDESEEKYNKLLKEEYGADWERVKKAAKLFSDAFKEFPFDMWTLYNGPQNAGPSNLLFEKKTNFDATMTGFSYDDLSGWSSFYPEKVYINQFKKLSDGFKAGLEEIKDMDDCEFKQVAYGAYSLFYSSYLQAEFITIRESENYKRILEILKEEKSLAKLMYDLMAKSSLFGYEAANHYYFNKGMLMEKFINCEALERLYKKKQKGE